MSKTTEPCRFRFCNVLLNITWAGPLAGARDVTYPGCDRASCRGGLGVQIPDTVTAPCLSNFQPQGLTYSEIACNYVRYLKTQLKCHWLWHFQTSFVAWRGQTLFTPQYTLLILQLWSEIRAITPPERHVAWCTVVFTIYRDNEWKIS